MLYGTVRSRTMNVARLHHYWDGDGVEVDLVVEADGGRVFALKVKATSSQRPGDARGVETLRNRLDKMGGDFICGVVLHTGERRFTLGDRPVALPIADTWA